MSTINIDNDPVNTLRAYVNARKPIIYINHYDFFAVDELIRAVSNDKIKIKEYNEADGQINFENKVKHNVKYNLNTFLSSLLLDINEKKEYFILLKDVHKNLDKPEICARLRSIAEKTMNEEANITIFLICSELFIPVELDKLITVFDMPFPNENKIKEIIDNFIKKIETKIKIKIDEEIIENYVFLLKGLSDFEIRQVLNLIYGKFGTIDIEGEKIILKEKEQIIKKAGILELVQDKITFNEIGGLEGLKDYLIRKWKIFDNINEAKEFGIEYPKGILIVGFPGCGKSLTAKASASLFNFPLLHFDIGKIKGKYYGESESKLRRVIKTAEAIAPCVLWIDEIEKSFAGIDGEGEASGVTISLLGQFITWLQEKKSPVYVVATANKIAKLPPEFLRKGRFDDIFLVDMPDDNERKKIFENHLRKRKQLSNEIDLNLLAKETEGFCGADIESVVKEAMEETFLLQSKTVTTEILNDCIKNTNSLKKLMEDKLKELDEEYTKYKFKDASTVINPSYKNEKITNCKFCRSENIIKKEKFNYKNISYKEKDYFLLKNKIVYEINCADCGAYYDSDDYNDYNEIENNSEEAIKCPNCNSDVTVITRNDLLANYFLFYFNNNIATLLNNEKLRYYKCNNCTWYKIEESN